jgi:hypothetical protein
VTVWVALGAAFFALTCGTPAPTITGTGPGSSIDDRIKSGVFVAISTDFTGFHSWQSFDVTSDAELAGIHDGSSVFEYIRQLPRAGSEEFPIGTIIVKEAVGGTMPHELLAMVKRGGGANPLGNGWEWVDLLAINNGKDAYTINWRGNGPPAGSETYGGDAKGSCNTCHVQCGNDLVCAKPLMLSNAADN